MKKLIIASTAAVLVLVACNNRGEGSPATDTATVTDETMGTDMTTGVDTVNMLDTSMMNADTTR